MKLLYFAPYFTPEKSSGRALVLDLLEGFADAGWNVEVYTPTPTRGVTEQERAFYKKNRTEQLFGGKVTVHRMPLYREKKSFLQRTIRFCFFSFQCLLKGLFVPADAIFTGSIPPSQGLITGIIRKLGKKRIIFNPQDLFPDSLITAGIASVNSSAVKIGRIIERLSYSQADLIITISNDMKQTIVNRCKDAEKVHVIPNWINTDLIRPISREENHLFDELGLPRNKFYVVYAGNIGYVQGIDSLVETAALLKDHIDIHFVIFGNGSEEHRIRKMIDDYQLANVSIYPLLDASRVSEVYSMGDVSLVTCKVGTGGAGMPSKTWTIMATGTPVLGFFDKPSEFSNLLESTKTGWCVEAGNIAELHDAIIELQRNKKLCEEYGRNARKHAEMFLSKNRAVSDYIRLISAMT